ncbi:ABC transporter permease [Chloroflexi bacterium TSY]|nr:ABC transporter permease [Chloroflexi bacterium TSY]
MRERFQRVTAPIFILIILLITWEGLVTLFQVEQFLLPKPTAIVSNLVKIVRLMPQTTAVEEIEADKVGSLLNANQLVVSIPREGAEAIIGETLGTLWGRISFLGTDYLFVSGKNLNPILRAAWFTLKEAMGGLAMGSVAGVLFALLTVRWVMAREALLPFAIAANSMPIIAFAPIMNNWFGLDNPFSKMAIVAIMTFFPMMINTARGLTLVDANSLELMHSYAASDAAILRKLRIPNALPYLFSGLKVSASLSMIGAIVGEYFGGPRIALGVFITQEAALFRFTSAWAAIIIACLIGITLYLIIVLVERLSMPWHVSFRDE